MPDQPTIVIFEAEPWERDYFAGRLPADRLRFVDSPLTPQNVEQAADAEVISVFIRSFVTPELLDKLPRLRFIATRSTGYDHVSLPVCRARGIAVSNVPRYGENTVAEHTFGLILALSRKIIEAARRTQQGQAAIEGLMGFDLKGKTLGVVGAGSIGLHVIRIGRAFGMDVLAYEVNPQPILAEVLGFEYVPLDDLLRRADVVSLHVPALPATYHLMDRERFALMKRGSLLINTARGSVVDTDALMWALDQGILAGAGLDVIEGEELLAEERQLLALPAAEEKLRAVLRHHALLRYPNVVITPHIAFYSGEALRRIADTTIGNITAFLEGAPVNVVT